jgi:hypothetical protein
MNKFILTFFLVISSGLVFSQVVSTRVYKKMTLYDFMEDYTEIAAKNAKKGKPEQLKKILLEIPNMAIESEKEVWKKMVLEAIETDNLQKSCKSCHSVYKKSYKKTYRKRLVNIPVDILED